MSRIVGCISSAGCICSLCASLLSFHPALLSSTVARNDTGSLSEEPGGDVRASPAPLSQALGMEPLGSRGRKQTLHVFACPAAESSLLRSDLEVESYEEATGLFHKNKQFQFARL